MRTRKRYSQWYGLILILMAIGILPLTAQIPPAENAKQQEPKQVPELEPIPVFDISLRSEETNSELNRIRSVLSPMPGVSAIHSEERAFRGIMNKSKESFKDIAIEDLSLKQLDEVRDEWQLHRMKIDAWQETVAARSQALEAESINIDQIHALWELTRLAAEEENYPNALKERINSVLSQIEEVETRLRRRLVEIFSLQGRLSNQALEIQDVLSRLDTAHLLSRHRLLIQDSPPLWNVLFAPKDEISLSSQIRTMWQKKSDTLTKYLNDNWERLLIHILIFIALSVFLFKWLKRSQKWLDEDEKLNAFVEIFKYPLSIALLITLLIANWSFPLAPQIFYKLIGVLFLIPLIRLIPELMTPDLRSSLYGLGGFYLLHSIYEQMPERSTIQRLLLFITISLAVGGLVWIQKKGGAFQNIGEERQKKARKLFVKVAIILLTIAWVANIFGYFHLSDLLLEGTFYSIYALVILLVSVVVLEGLLAIFLKSHTAQSFKIFRLHTQLWKRKTAIFLSFAAVFVWFYYVLKNYAILDPVLSFLAKVIESPLKIGSLSISLGDIIAFLLTLWLSVLLARFIRFVLGEDVLPRMTLPRGVSGAISFVAYYFVLLVGFLFALSAAGIELSRFALLAGALGIGIGFGLQNLVNNFVSGLILVFERPIKVGDWIEFGSQRGRVLRIGIRSSTIQNWEGAEVIVPNGSLISSEVINWTLSDRRRRLKVALGVAYGTDPNRVMEILNDVAKNHSSVLDNPAPSATFDGFGDSSLNFDLRFSIAEFDDWLRVKSEVTLAVNNALKDAGIEIPFPQRDLHVRSIDKEVQKGLLHKGDKPRKNKK